MTSAVTSPVRVSATRADRAGRFVEQFRFSGPWEAKLASTLYLPEDPTGGVVICPSICIDFLRNYRREVLLARALAANGVAVHRFHYRGTGNSDGAPGDTSASTMADDAAWAADELTRCVPGLRVGFVGTRFGALPAAAAAARRHDAPLALVEPTIDAAQFFREGFRARLASGMTSGGAEPRTTKQLVAELHLTGCIEVLGQTIDRSLYASSVEVDVVDVLLRAAGPVLLVELGTGDHRRPELVRLEAALAERGRSVDHRSAGSRQSWWFLDEDDRSQPGGKDARTAGGLDEVVAAVAKWLQERLPGEAT